MKERSCRSCDSACSPLPYLGENAAGRGAGLAVARDPDRQQGRHRKEEAHRVDGESEAGAVCPGALVRAAGRDQESRQGGSDQQAELPHTHQHGVGDLQLGGPEDLRQDGAARGICERRAEADAERQHVDHPHMDGAGKHQRREQTGEHRIGAACRQENPPRREPIDQRAADQHERSARQGHDGQYESELRGVAGELQHQPWQSDQGELISHHGNRAAAEEQAEIAIRKR